MAITVVIVPGLPPMPRRPVAALLLVMAMLAVLWWSVPAGFGALRLSELCRQIEHALRADASDAIDARIGDASRAFAAALAAMDEALAGKEHRDD